MSSKKVKITGTAGQGTRKVQRVGFKNLDKAKSKTTIWRWQKEGKTEIDCDPAVNVKGQKNLGREFKKDYGKYGNARQIKRLEDAGLPYVPVGSEHGYCTDSCYWWYDNIYRPKIRRIKQRNLKSKKLATDVSGSY